MTKPTRISPLDISAKGRPNTPNAMDDEFDDSTGSSGAVNGLDAKWAWRNQSTSTATFPIAGCLTLTIPQAATTNFRIIEQTKPAAQDFTIEAKIAIGGVRASYVYGGICLVDGVNGDLYIFCMRVAAGNHDIAVQRWNSVTSYNGDLITALLCGVNYAYLRVSYVNSTNTLTFWHSADGLAWVKLVSLVDAVVATKVGLMINEENNQGGTSMLVDYFRRIA